MDKASEILAKLMSLLQKISALLLIAMTVVVFIQIGGRNFLHISTPWTEEVSRLLLIWMTFTGSPPVLYRGEHLMVDLIYANTTKWGRKYLNLLSNGVILAFCVIGMKLGADLCTNRIVLRSVTPAASIPRVWLYAALPAGCFFMLLAALDGLVSAALILAGRREDREAILVADESRTLDEIEESGGLSE